MCSFISFWPMKTCKTYSVALVLKTSEIFGFNVWLIPLISDFRDIALVLSRLSPLQFVYTFGCKVTFFILKLIPPVLTAHLSWRINVIWYEKEKKLVFKFLITALESFCFVATRECQCTVHSLLNKVWLLVSLLSAYWTHSSILALLWCHLASGFKHLIFLQRTGKVLII